MFIKTNKTISIFRYGFLKPTFFILILLISYSSFCEEFIKEYTTPKRIKIQEGLSQSRILSILEDSRGFMWFGTKDGLNRYDGYSMKIYRNIFNDSTSLPNNHINTMVEDSNGIIWIGTQNGIVMFDPFSELFKSIVETDPNALAQGANKITSCAIDQKKNIWFGTDGYGIIKINNNSLEKEYFFNENDSTMHLNSVSRLFIDSKNRLWIGGYINEKVSCYNIIDGILNDHKINGLTKSNPVSRSVSSFYEDNSGRIWTNVTNHLELNGSLYYLEDGQSVFKNYNHFMTQDFENGFQDSFNSITSIFGDNDGNIWFGSLLSGIFKVKFGRNPEAYYMKSPVTDARINCIYQSKNGLIWIGTNGNGIELFAPKSTEFNLLSYKYNQDFTIESIRTFAEDDNYYWVGGYYGLAKIDKDFNEIEIIQNSSVYCLQNSRYNDSLLHTGSEGGGYQPINKYTETFTKFITNRVDVYQIRAEYVYSIYELSNSLVLLGTRNGLLGYHPSSDSMFHIKYSVTSLPESNSKETVRCIYEDNWGNILIGFVNGNIGKLNNDCTSIEKFELIPDLQIVHSANPVNCIFNDHNNDYWIATNNGLIYYKLQNNELKFYTKNDGLPNDHIYSILPGEENNLWMSTNNGISNYIFNDNIFINYDIGDGLQNNEFNTGAYFKASNGYLFFGGINGFNYFDPKKIKSNSIIPDVVITEVTASEKSLVRSKEDIHNNLVIINSEHDIFTIEFAGLSFINCSKNRYKYRLREVNDKWTDLEDQRKIRFTNLPPGNYNLEILAANNHGLWVNEPFRCEIEVLPTFFESAAFKWSMAFTLIIAIILIIRWRLKAITRQKNKLQLLVNQQTAALLVSNESLKEEIAEHAKTSSELRVSNKTKDKFLSIIAHDLLSPLGVVMGFSDLLVDESYKFNDTDRKSFNKTINLTTKRLISLLTNLLQWSKLQSGALVPNPQKLDLSLVAVEVLDLLQANIIEKEIEVVNKMQTPTFVYADKNMLLIILRNLISNAIKFTNNSGMIKIDSVAKGDKIQVEITDNGVGISEENMKKLFNPKANYTTKGTNEEPGTGIGLSLAREFVELNRGSLWVKSTVNKGSSFYFTLSVND